MKITTDTLRVLSRVSKTQREKIESIVRRHVSACYRNGFPPENLDRVYLEAMEIVNLEERFPEPVAEEERDWEPARRYDQYVSPKAA